MSGQIEFSVEGDQRKSHFPILFINFKSHVKTFFSALASSSAQEQLLCVFFFVFFFFPPKLHLCVWYAEIGTYFGVGWLEWPPHPYHHNHSPLASFYAQWGRGGMAREGGRVSKEDPHYFYFSVRLSQHSPPKLPIVVRRSYGYGDPFPHHDLC